MHEQGSKKQDILNRLSRLKRLTFLALSWENATIAFWTVDLWILFFAGLWLLEIPALFGTAGSALALIVFFAGLVYGLAHAFRRFKWPAEGQVSRRLHETNKLEHRPLEQITDKLANPGHEGTQTLWRAQVDSAFAYIKKLTPSWPQPVLTKHDPFALRALVVLFVIIGVTVSGPSWSSRLAYGLFPFSVHWQDQLEDNILLWITPPEYTQREETTLQPHGREKEPVDIVTGSTLKLRVQKGMGTPSIEMGGKSHKLAPLGKGSWQIELPVSATDHIRIKQLFRTRAALNVSFIPDTPPTASLKGEIEPLPKGPLQVPLLVRDDFGITDLTMNMTLDPEIENPPLGNPLEENRGTMSPPGTETEIKPVYDLTWHPWAGLNVLMTFEVRDHLGQSATIGPVRVKLPERPFYHPVAQRLVEMRKRLIWTPESASTNIVYELEDLLSRPDQFGGDYIAFLAIRSAASRLLYSPSEESTIEVTRLLWDTALRIEDGNLTLAARNLRESQQALEKLLRDPNATDEEIARAIENLQQNMAQYFYEIFKQTQAMAQNGQMPQFSPEMFNKVLNAEDLAAFMDQMRANALSGNRDAARQLLSQLQQIMDGIDPSRGFSMPPEMQQTMENINDLKNLIEEQQDLLDETSQKARQLPPEPQALADYLPFQAPPFEGWDNGFPPPPQDTVKPDTDKKRKDPKVSTQEEKEKQAGLRHDLGGIMLDTDEQMGNIPPNMQKAEQEMRGAENMLGENNPRGAVSRQEQALAYLKENLNEMQQQLMQMMQQMTLMSFGAGGLDPLGRPLEDGNGSSIFGSKVKIPDEAQKKRVRDIMNELRERSSDRTRPDYELEYYRRLMKQF